MRSFSASSRRQRGGGLVWVLVILALVMPLGTAAWLEVKADPPPPDVTITSTLPGVGQETGIHVELREQMRGLENVKVELVQGEHTVLLHEKHFTPRPTLKPWDGKTPEHAVDVKIGRKHQDWLTPGELVVKVTASHPGTLFSSHEPVEKTLTLPVTLMPPALSPTSQFVFTAQGGSEAVVYRVGPSSVHDGVQAGDWFFPGSPLPNGAPDEHFVLFAIPYDMDDASSVKLVAEDALGNRAEAPFIHKFTPRKMGKDTIQLQDKFLEKVVAEILPRTPGMIDKKDLLANFLQLNGELRRQNNAFLREMAKSSRKEFLWNDTFQPLQNAKVMGAFADRRTYVRNGSPVDTQDHLGFDLASLHLAPVNASNSGVVMHAGWLGIYGNAVVVDHGFGLMSLYAHLSSMDVQAGQMVTRGQNVGRTGATGMAGGDHLHFTMLLHGLPVTPIEWWDSKWIADRLRLKLGSALPAPAKG